MPHPQELYIGLMSGTSMDGVDAVLADFERLPPTLLATHYLPFDDGMKGNLLALQQPGHNELHQAQLIGNRLAALYAAAAKKVLSAAKISPEDIKALGCHGQTVRHCPEHGYTLQLGNAALLAELTGITVVSDFRSRDIAAGGQGAPLVPAFHDIVMRNAASHRVIVNIGGISNLTNLEPGEPTTGFDCGPGNMLMDAWCIRHLDKPFDKGGVWAASGDALPSLLEKMLAEPFFSLPPPKSSGRELFNLPWLQGKLNGTEKPVDVQATLLQLTCRAIAESIRQYCSGAQEIYLCGGGAHNRALHACLTELLPECKIETTDSLGVNGDYLEATAFAWLAQQNLQGRPANLPRVTGAEHPCILGAVYRHS